MHAAVDQRLSQRVAGGPAHAALGRRAAEADVEVRRLAVHQRANVVAVERLLQALPQLLAQHVDVRMHRAVGQELQDGRPGSRRHRIGVVGAGVRDALAAVPGRVAALLQPVHDVGSTAHGRARQAAGHDLRHRGQVGRDAGHHLEAARRHAESGHDLVQDQHGVMFGRQAAQPVNERRLDGQRAPTGAAGLHDHRRHVALGQFLAHPVQVSGQRRDGSLGGRRNAGGRRDVVRLFNPHRRVVVPTVEVALELDDPVAAGVRPRQPHGHVRGLGSRGVEAHALDAGLQALDLLRPANLEFVAGPVVGADFQLLPRRVHGHGVPVSQDQRAVAHRVVHDLVAVHVPLAGALGAGRHDREGRLDAGVVRHAPGQRLARLRVQRLRPGVPGCERLLDRAVSGVGAHCAPPMREIGTRSGAGAQSGQQD